jgi:hypothetical protein
MIYRGVIAMVLFATAILQCPEEQRWVITLFGGSLFMAAYFFGEQGPPEEPHTATKGDIS